MWRLVLTAIVVGGLVFVGAPSAAAFDYQEPSVPSPFLLTQEGPAPAVALAEGIGPTFMFRLALEDLETAAAMPSSGTRIQTSIVVVTDSEGGGWGLWYWGR